MSSSAPLIGFDRFIRLEWIDLALSVGNGTATYEELNEALMSSGLGTEALAKTRTKLNALGLCPRPDLKGFIDRGRILRRENQNADALVVFAWGAASVSYPFFGKVAELVGRLTSLQGDCSVSEIHRRMSEVYGAREITKRATQAVLQTQSTWGTIERVEKAKRVIRLEATAIESPELTAWLIEAAVRYAGKPLSVSGLQSLPILFPFTLTTSLAYLVSNSPNLSLRSDGPSNQFVALRPVF